MKTSSSDGCTARTRRAGQRRRRAASPRTASTASSASALERDVQPLAEHLRVDDARAAPRTASSARRRRRAPPLPPCGRPISARSRAGSSTASTRPSCSSATRVQRSASSRYGVDITMVMPRARNSDSSFQNSRRETGSTPVVGSSSRISSGSWTSVQASASFCFMPPDSRSARRSRNGVSCVISSSCVAARLVVAHAVDLGEELDVLVDGQVAVEAEALRQVADALGDAARARAPDRARARAPSPASACSRPHISRIAVVLPAPSGPIRPNISPRRRRRSGRPARWSRRSASRPPVNRTASALTGSTIVRVHRHALLQDAGAVVHGDLDAVDQLRSLVGGLHVARRELGARRDEGHRARQRLPPASVRTVAAWPSLMRGTVGSGTNSVGPGVVEVGDDDERRAAAPRSRRRPRASA